MKNLLYYLFGVYVGGGLCALSDAMALGMCFSASPAFILKYVAAWPARFIEVWNF